MRPAYDPAIPEVSREHWLNTMASENFNLFTAQYDAHLDGLKFDQ